MGWQDEAIPINDETTDSQKWKTEAIAVEDESGISADRQKLLREKYVYGLSTPHKVLRETFSKHAAHEIVDPAERQFIFDEVAQVSRAQEWAQNKDYNESSFLSRFGTNLTKLAERTHEAVRGMVNQPAEILDNLSGNAPPDSEVLFQRALESAHQQQNPSSAKMPGISGAAAGIAADWGPGLYAGGKIAGGFGAAATEAGAGAKVAGVAAGVGMAETFQQPIVKESYYSQLEAGVPQKTARWTAPLSGVLQTAVFSQLQGLLPDKAKGKVAKTITDALVKNYGKAILLHGTTPMAEAAAIDQTVKELSKWSAGKGFDLGAIAERTWEGAVTGTVAGGVFGLPKAGGEFGAVMEGKRTEVYKNEIITMAASGKTPSKMQMQKWGLEVGDTRAESRANVKDKAAELQNAKLQERSVADEEIAKEFGLGEAFNAAERPAEQPISAAEQKPVETPIEQAVPTERPAEPPAAAPVEVPVVAPTVDAWAESAKPAAYTPSPEVTSLAKAMVADNRTKRGDSPLEGRTPEKVIDWLTEGEKARQEDKYLEDRIITRLQQKPGSSVNEREEAVLQLAYRDRNNAFDAASERLSQAAVSGDPAEVVKAQTEANAALELVRDVEVAADAAHSTWGKTGVAMKIALMRDFTPTSLLRKAQVAKGGRELTPEETTKITEMGTKIQELEGKLKAYESSEPAPETPRKKSFAKKESARKAVDAAWVEFKAAIGKIEPFISGESGSLRVGGEGSKKLTVYEKFIADGNNPRDWDNYRIKQNEISRKKNVTAFFEEWNSGKEISGNTIVNFLREKGVDIPLEQKRRLDHDDTFVSKTSTEGRGLPKTEARRIHKTVSDAINNLLKGESGAINVDVVKSGLKLAKAYGKLGTATIEDFLVKAKEGLGEEFNKHKDSLIAAWNQYEKGSLEDRVKRTSKALDRSIKQLESDLQEGNIGFKKKIEPISTPEIDAKRASLKELREQREWLREATGLTEAKRTADYDKNLTKRLDEYQRKLDEGEFEKPVKEFKPLSKTTLDLKFQLEQVKTKFKGMQEDWVKQQYDTLTKTLHLTSETLNFSRALMTSYDVSAVLRQGGFFTFGHPIQTAKELPDMFRAFWSQRGEFESAENIRNRKNYQLYGRDKLSLSTSEGSLYANEEAYMGGWLHKLAYGEPKTALGKILLAPARLATKPVIASERAYITFLNRQRADMYDSFTATLTRTGVPTVAEGSAIANFINVATGRASLDKMQSASNALATAFFAPRYTVSRFQLLLGQPAWHGTARTRLLVAKEYARTLIGLGLFYGAMKAAFGDDVRTEFDSRSSDFGKVIFKDGTRIDTLFGVAQATVITSRLGMGLLSQLGITDAGAIKKPTGELIKMGEGWRTPGASDIISRFLRGKLSPWLGSAIDVTEGKNLVGETVTPLSAARKALTPLSFGDIYDVMRKDKIPRSVALSLLVMLGMGAQNYQNATPAMFAKKIAEHPNIRGVSKQTKLKYDYTETISQVVKQAKKNGISESAMLSALHQQLRKEGVKPDTIQEWKIRLRKRLHQF